jgi:hypothetical protein
MQVGGHMDIGVLEAVSAVTAECASASSAASISAAMLLRESRIRSKFSRFVEVAGPHFSFPG